MKQVVRNYSGIGNRIPGSLQIIPRTRINFTFCHIERSEISAFLKWIISVVQDGNVAFIMVIGKNILPDMECEYAPGNWR